MPLMLRTGLACLALLSLTSVATAAAPDRPSPAEAKKDGTDKPAPPGQAKENGRDTAPGQLKEPGTPAQPKADTMLQDPGPAADPSLTQLGETVGAAPAGGDVKVRLPGSDEWTALSDDAPLPIGSTVDASEGLVEIAAEVVSGAEQNAVVTGAVFRVDQDVIDQGRTDLTLQGGDFARCDATASRAKARAAATRKRTKSGVVRGLWAAGKGRFRTRGRYGAASVRGTRWATVDRCSSTTIKVFDGIVDVTDLITGRTVAVEAGEKHVLRAKGARRR
jgi:hypothetical protein